MLQCRREWLLFDGVVAATHLGTATHLELAAYARGYWHDGLSEEQLIRVLRG